MFKNKKHKIYQIISYHNTILSYSNELVIHSFLALNSLVFIKLTDNLALILPFEYINNLNEINFIPKRIRYSRNSRSFSMFIVKYRNKNNGHVNIMDYKTLKYWCAPPIMKNKYQSEMDYLRDWAREWEDFRLHCIGEVLMDNLACVEIILNKILPHAFSLLDFIKFNQFSIDLLLQLYNFEDLMSIFQPFFNQRNIEHIKDLYPNDIVLKHSFKHKLPDVISEEYDYLHTFFNRDLYDSPGHIINQIYRSTIKPYKKACVVATARNEGIYLLEFVAYYLSLGFDTIYIYSNDNDDGSDILLEALARHGFIKYIKNIIKSNISAQFKAYMHAVMYNYELLNHEFALFVDTDEFLYLNNNFFININDFIQFHKLHHSDSIAINWITAGANENIQYRDQDLIFRFPKLSNKNICDLVKPLVRPHLVGAMNCHNCIPVYNKSLIYTHSTGKILSTEKHKNEGRFNRLAFTDDPCTKYAFIIHYLHKSFSEFIYKFGRNRGCEILTHGINYKALTKFLFQVFSNSFSCPEPHFQPFDEINTRTFLNIKDHIKSYADILSAHAEVVCNFEKILPNYFAAFFKHLNTRNDLKEVYLNLKNKFPEKFSKYDCYL